jgi:phosphoadenosine phosphosulfate reductase
LALASPRLPDLDFEAMTAEDVLRWACERFGGRMCLTCSWQRQSSVLVHMVSELGLEVDVVELDTQVLFPETYETRDRLVERYELRLKSFRPVDAPDRLWETDADRCCRIRKVEPLERALRGYDAWITGIRREQALTRANAQKVEWSKRYGVWKIQPLVDWDAKRVQAYLVVNEIPYNPLHDAGYPSIGCIPCTRPVAAGEGERAGRWAESEKIECGIHSDRSGVLSAKRTGGKGLGEPGGSPSGVSRA